MPSKKTELRIFRREWMCDDCGGMLWHNGSIENKYLKEVKGKVKFYKHECDNCDVLYEFPHIYPHYWLAVHEDFGYVLNI